MRILFAGGGSAGHLSPGIAIAERLRQQDPEAQVYFACSERALDAHVLEAAGLEHFPLPSAPFPYRPSPQAAAACWRLLQATRQAQRLLRQVRPQAVMGVGGFVSVPVLLAARLARLPIAALVLDAQPDRANRLVARWAQWIALAFPQAAQCFPANRVEVSGCPVRRAILEAMRPVALETLGLDPTRPTILVMGGSQGARRINQALVGVLPELLGTLRTQVIHLTGERDYAQVQEQSSAAAALYGHYFAYPFAEDMGSLLAAADLVISRAGSSSVAEASVRGCPQILIPLRHAGGHQLANAQPLVAAGAALLLPDEQCTPIELLRYITRLVQNEPARLEMSRAAYRWSSPHAAERLADGLLALARGEAPAAA